MNGLVSENDPKIELEEDVLSPDDAQSEADGRIKSHNNDFTKLGKPVVAVQKRYVAVKKI